MLLNLLWRESFHSDIYKKNLIVSLLATSTSQGQLTSSHDECYQAFSGLPLPCINVNTNRRGGLSILSSS